MKIRTTAYTLPHRLVTGMHCLFCFLLQRCKRINDVDDEDVGEEDDDVHQQADAHEIAEAVAAGTVH